MIVGDEMEVKVVGNDMGGLMVFLHGFPDDASIWDRQVAFFKQDYRCALITLPGFGTNKLKKTWGYNFDELALMLSREISKLQKRPDEKVIFMGHDWGSIVGFYCQDHFPELFDALIIFDVGPPAFDQPSLKLLPRVMVLAMLYMGWLAFFFFMSRVVPFSMGKKITNPLVRQFALRLEKGLEHPTKAENVSIDMCYPYYYMMTNFFKEFFGMKARMFRYSKRSGDLPGIPTLFFYGAKQPIKFYSPHFEYNLKRNPVCDVVPMQTGHWITDKEENKDEINERINTFIQLKL